MIKRRRVLEPSDHFYNGGRVQQRFSVKTSSDILVVLLSGVQSYSIFFFLVIFSFFNTIKDVEICIK
jgi:hypothetical protein